MDYIYLMLCLGGVLLVSSPELIITIDQPTTNVSTQYATGWFKTILIFVSLLTSLIWGLAFLVVKRVKNIDAN